MKCHALSTWNGNDQSSCYCNTMPAVLPTILHGAVTGQVQEALRLIHGTG